MARKAMARVAGRIVPVGVFVLAVGCGSDAESSANGVGGAGQAPASGGATGGTPTFQTATGETSAGAGGTGGAPGPAAGSGGTPPSGGSANLGGSAVTGGRSSTGGQQTGGAHDTAGGPNTGGLENTGGAQSTGGAQNAGGLENPGGTDNAGGTEPETPDIGPRACGCETPGEEFGTVNQTIIVGSGEVYDGQCKVFRANPSTLGPGDQSEDQSPVFRVNGGGTLRNVVLGASAADGIHLYGDVVLENVHWLDIGEDAMTVKQSGTVHLYCGSAKNGEDKMFQVNAESEIHISDFTGSNAGKFMRQNGNTTFRVDVYIDHCDISDMDEVIFRTDSSTSHVTLTNTRYSRLGDGLFMFGSSVTNGNSGQSTVTNCEEY